MSRLSHCTSIKFVLGGRFKKYELFSEEEKIKELEFKTEIVLTFNIW